MHLNYAYIFTNCMCIYLLTACALLAVLACVIPQLDNFISLVGALSSSALALIFPPVLHSLTLPGSSKLIHAKNIAIALFGTVGGVFGTVMAIESIVNNY